MSQKDKRHWLNAERLAIYPKMMFLILFAMTLYRFLTVKGMVDRWGLPLGSDFVTFWSASRIGLGANPEDAYNLDVISGVEKLAAPLEDASWAWFYPPTFYLVILPLSLLPYAIAYAVFILPTLFFYLKTLLRIVNGTTALWCMAAFPGIWICFLHGQNGFLTAALAASALLVMPSRPILSGVLIGLLAIKPHLAPLFPLALMASGNWKTFLVAALVTLLFFAAGIAVLGWQTLAAFLSSLALAKGYIESGALPLGKMPTYFALMRELGASAFAAYVVHFSLAAGAAMIVWKMWRDQAAWSLRCAALMTATFLVSPFVYDYDLVWLAFPVAWISILGQRDGWMPLEIEILVAVWLLPLVMPLLADDLSLQIGPVIVTALLWLIWRRHAGAPTGTTRYSIQPVRTGSAQTSS